MMAGGRYAIVECNTYGPDADAGQLRAKFSLSSAGESVALYYRNSSGKMECIQKVDFPSGIPTGKTIARRPDLSGPFGQSESPSRGLPNP
jgi:hypothetical protein